MINFDIAVIGAGVIGCAAARELSAFNAKICVLERASDVCEGTSKANSAIIHAGFDALPNTLKAEMNVRGNEMMDNVARDLGIPFKRVGAMVVSTDKDTDFGLNTLLERGITNGVKNMKILTRDEAIAIEPNLSDDVTAALYAPTSGIVCPFEMTFAYAENAAENGAKFMFNCRVVSIERDDNGFIITAENISQNTEIYHAKAIVNAAGLYSDTIHNMVCGEKIKVHARRGEYFLLDKTAGNHLSRTIFQLPNKFGKGVLVSPTVDGNLLVGPTASDTDDREGTLTTAEGYDELIKKSALSVKNTPLRQVITSFSGLRSVLESSEDFIIGETAESFFDAAGIDSPGLSSAPAIAKHLAEIISKKLSLDKNESFDPIRKAPIRARELSFDERKTLIEKNPAYGTIVCRCEEISEGEILDAIHAGVGATTLDGIKRRTRAGAGRCQSGFCSPRVMDILARELKLDLTQINKNGPSSQIVFEPTRKEKNL